MRYPTQACLFAGLLLVASGGRAPAQVSNPAHHHAWASNVVVPQRRAFVMPHAPVHARRLPVQITRVTAGVVVVEQMATTTMDISLHNPAATRQEAQLLVPVPDGAVVKGFDFQGAGKEPSATLLPKTEATRIYQSIVAQVRDPALLEFAGMNLIRSSVFPVEARGSQKVRLVYEHLLRADGDRVDYLLPRSEALDYTVPWTIGVKIKSKRKIATVYSPSHEIETVRRGDGQVSVRTRPGAKQAGAYRLSWLLERGDMTASLFAYPDPAIGGGYFMLLMGLPAEKKENRPSIKREVTVVLDRSGSMNGQKMEQARAAALQVLAGLENGEAFNLIVYNEAVDLFAERPVIKSNESMAAARSWLEGVHSRGGTNIHDALVEALRQKTPQGMLPLVLFLTDGLPTIGQTSEKTIRELATRGNRARKRIFTFGVGVDVNTALLEKLASETRAFATFVLPGEDVEVKVAKVYNGLAGPVLADTVLRVAAQPGTGSRVREVLPRTLPDLFEGDQLTVLGQYVGEKPLQFTIGGNYLGRTRSFRFKFELGAATTRNAFVPRLWASRKIAVLVDAIRSSGADVDQARLRPGVGSDPRIRELADEIVRLSTEFGILTEYTAFLAREGTDLGHRNEVMAEAMRNFQQRAVQTRSGIGSVNQDMNRQSLSQQKVLNPYNEFYDSNMERVSITSVQQVNDRAFYRRGNRWVDSRIVNRESTVKPSRVIRFGSEDFQKLVERLARQGRQGSISLQGDILLEVEGESVLVKGARAP